MENQNTDIDSMDDLNGLLDGLENPPADNPGGDPPSTETDPPAAETDPPATDPPAQDKQPQAQPDKAHLAFVQMRTQNKQMMDAMKIFAKNNGIDFTDEADLMAKVQDQDLSKRAEAAQVPKEVLERMERLEHRDKEYTQEQLKTKALIGFQKLKDTYELTPAELQEFGDKLFEVGNNPFETDVELEKEYRNMYFDQIVQKRVDAAVEAALKRDSAARTNGSNPSGKRGVGSHTGKEVSTVGDLNALLDSLNPTK